MSFISDTDKSQFQAAYKVFFDTFKEDVIIHRRAKLGLDDGFGEHVDINLKGIFGYEEPAYDFAAYPVGSSNHTYEIENSTFGALVMHPSSQGHRNTSDFSYAEEISANLIEGEIVIKVEEDCKDYLTTAPVERVDVGNKAYKVASKDSQVHKVITGYYFFKLEESK